MQSKYDTKIFIFSKIIKVMGKTKTIHLFLTFQLSSLEKNNSKIYWKTSLDDSEFKSGQFLQKKFRCLCSKNWLPRKKRIPWGVNKTKKDDTLKKRLHSMPENRWRFWETFRKVSESNNLSINLEHLKNN